MVVVDLVASLRLWAGSDPRIVAMLLREADVVRGSFADLAALTTDVDGVRSAMRPGATLVLDDEATAVATGAFGEVRCTLAAESAAESSTAAICAELARPSGRVESASARWHRVLQGRTRG